jgi:hypothetical protein
MRKLLSVTSILLIGVYGVILILGMAVGPSRPGVVNYLKASLPKIQVRYHTWRTLIKLMLCYCSPLNVSGTIVLWHL